MFGGGPSSPTDPDQLYNAAYTRGTRGAGANLIDSSNPYFSQKYKYNPRTGRWSENTRYSPQARSIFDSNIATQQGLATAGQSAVGKMKDILGTPFNTEGLPPISGEGGPVETALLERLNRQLTSDRADLDSRLTNQGITATSNPEAYGKSVDPFNRSVNDARLAAIISADNEARQNREMAFGERVGARQIPLQELIAILNAGQSALPGLPGVQSVNPNLPDYAQVVSGSRADLANVNNFQNVQNMQNIQAALRAYSAASSGGLSELLAGLKKDKVTT